jgi:hypothetical protein
VGGLYLRSFTYVEEFSTYDWRFKMAGGSGWGGGRGTKPEVTVEGAYGAGAGAGAEPSVWE